VGSARPSCAPSPKAIAARKRIAARAKQKAEYADEALDDSHTAIAWAVLEKIAEGAIPMMSWDDANAVLAQHFSA
jgi:hypothetical protein